MLNSISSLGHKGVSQPATGKDIKLENVVKRYGDFVAVDNINLEIKGGEFLTLLGPSGSGKTSTLMMVAGFETPNTGSIEVDGRNIVSLSPQHRQFGVVFQGYALFPHMSALENVEFPLRMRRVEASARRKLATDMLEKVGLSSMIHRKPRELSGGQQQRVALARALVFQPDALLLDEPLGALDKNMRERMQYEIKQLQRNLGITVLFVTHDQDEAMSMSDRIAVMNEGRIVQLGSPKDVYKHPATTFVANFLGETNLVPCEILETRADKAQVSIGQGLSCSAAIQSATTVSGDGKTVLSIRPENVSILRGGEAADIALQGIVREHTFVGRHTRTIIEAIGMEFAVVSNDGGDTIRIGESISFGWMGRDTQAIAAP